MYVLNILIASAFFISSNAFSVDDLEKCSIKDDECMKRSLMKTMKIVAKDGIPDANISAIDPLHIKNFSVTILESLMLTFDEGVLKGIKDCEVKKYHIDLEKKTSTSKFVCDVSVKGHFKIAGSSPAIQSLLGRESIRGEGNAKVKIEKITIDSVLPLNFKKHDDGKIYLEYPGEKIKLKFDIEKATFFADKIFIGKEDISNFVVTYLNENWKLLMQNFGKVFLDKALDHYSDLANNLFNLISVDKLFIEDLSEYVN